MNTLIKASKLAMLSATVAVGATHAMADSNPTSSYEITVTNITKGISFTPILAASHSKSISYFTLGEPASNDLATIAESGDIAPLQTTLDASDAVLSTASTAGLLEPGTSVTFQLDGRFRFNQLSFAAMLLPTNDSFVALNGAALPRKGSITYLANAYDAGSETNDELCASIPGPTCEGAALSPEDEGEGFVFPSPGISGEADLPALDYNWMGSVATVTIVKL